MVFPELDNIHWPIIFDFENVGVKRKRESNELLHENTKPKVLYSNYTKLENQLGVIIIFADQRFFKVQFFLFHVILPPYKLNIHKAGNPV